MAYWYEVRTTGISSNSGGFDVDAAFVSDFTSSTGLSTFLIVSSPTYAFQNSDIGQYLYIFTSSSGLWITGFYAISGLSGTSAIINAQQGQYFQRHRPAGLSLQSGVGKSDGLTTGRWAIDRSQSATAWTSNSNDLFITSVNSYVGSNNYRFTNADIGNSIRIQPSAGFGTGTLKGNYFITGIAGTLATLNTSPGGIGTQGGIWALGGAISNPNDITIAIQSGGLWMQSGTYDTGTGITIGDRIFFYGYNTIRGDNPKGDDRPLIRATAPNLRLLFTTNSASIMNHFSFLRFSGNGFTNIIGHSYGNSRNQISYCKASQCLLGFSSSSHALYCEAYNCTTGFSGGEIYGCVAVGCTSIGFNMGLKETISNSVAMSCLTGFSGCDVVYSNDIAYKCGTGYLQTSQSMAYVNCIAVGCTQFGFRNTNTWMTRYVGCATFGNTADALDGGYVFLDDVIKCTQNPLLDPDNNDFRLNDLPGGGALLKSRGGLGSIINMPSSTSFEDPGAVQGARKIFLPNMSGGIGG